MNHLWDNSESGFEAFHKANPHVYELFKRFASEARAAGFKRAYGYDATGEFDDAGNARLVVRRIQWQEVTPAKKGRKK